MSGTPAPFPVAENMQELRKHWLEHLQCCNEIVTYQILETEGAAVRHTALHHRDALLGALTV